MTAQDTKHELGYKQTEVGMIPEDWEPTPLGFLSAFITKGATPTTYGFSWANDGVLFLRSECVSEQGLDLTQSMFITPEVHNILKRGEVRAGDILITITGNVGRVIYLKNDFGIANINQHIARIRILDINVAADYVFHFLSQSTVRKYYGSITTGQAYPQISLKQVRDTRVPIPPTKSEQTAIATALSDVDALLTSLDKLITKKRDIKQAAMQQLLTGKTRLPKFGGELKPSYKQTKAGVIPVDWEVHALGDEIDQLEAGVSVNSVDEEFHTYEHGLAILKTSAVSNGYFLPHENKKIAPRDIKRARLNPRIDSIIISRMNTPDLVGECGYIGKDYPNLFLPDRLWMTRIKRESTINVKWLSYLLSYKEYKIKIKETATGTSGSMKNISQGSLLSINIPFPAPEEQQAIATVLSDMDAEIVALEQKRDKTRALKQGMMQELLTGKTRLL